MPTTASVALDGYLDAYQARAAARAAAREADKAPDQPIAGGVSYRSLVARIAAGEAAFVAASDSLAATWRGLDAVAGVDVARATARRLWRAFYGRDYEGDFDVRLALLREEFVGGRGINRVHDVVAASLTYRAAVDGTANCGGAKALYPLASHPAASPELLAGLAQDSNLGDGDVDPSYAALANPRCPIGAVAGIAESYDPRYGRLCYGNRRATFAARVLARRLQSVDHDRLV